MIVLVVSLLLQIAPPPVAECGPPLKALDAGQLFVDFDTNVGKEFAPGGHFVEQVFQFDPDRPSIAGSFRAWKVIDSRCVEWRLTTPEAAPYISVAVDGAVNIQQNAPGGLHAAIEATIKGSGRRLQDNLYVYISEAQPLVGSWRQTGVINCSTGAVTAVDPAKHMEELSLFSSGWFTVTWAPFESYKDYWGHYTATRSTVEIAVEGGNDVPPGIVPKGTFSRVGKTLVLKGISFGLKNRDDSFLARRHCGYVFTGGQ